MSKELDGQIISQAEDQLMSEDFQSPQILVEPYGEREFAMDFLLYQNVFHLYDESTAADVMRNDFPSWQQNMTARLKREESVGIVQTLTLQTVARIALEQYETAWDELAVALDDGGDIQTAGQKVVSWQRKSSAADLAAKREGYSEKNKLSAFKDFIENEIDLDGI